MVVLKAGSNDMLAKYIVQVPVGKDEVYCVVVVNCKVHLSTNVGKLLKGKDPRNRGYSNIPLAI